MATDSLLTNLPQRVDDLNFRLKYILQPLEESRLKIKKRRQILWLTFWGVFLIVALLTILLLPLNMGVSLPVPVIYIIAIMLFTIPVGIIYFIIFAFWIFPKDRELQGLFHSQVIPHVLSEFLSDARFAHEGCISESEYVHSDIFRKRIDRYSGDNQTSGLLGETKVKFSRLHTEYKTESRGKNGQKQTHWHTIFEGVLLIADFNKNTQGRTFILKDSAEKMFGGIGRWMQDKFGSSGRGEMVYLEDVGFEKEYVVYSDDAVEARYLLTPSMQECFVDLSKYFGSGNVSASIINGKLYLALSGKFELFSFKRKKSLMESDTIKYYAENLFRVLKVVEILDLNTRIWGR